MIVNLSKVIGHRGASGYAPENTFASMQKAADLNISWVEFDVMLTADGISIVFHDDKLNRTTNGKGYVAKTRYEAIAQLDAGSWFAKTFRGEPVPKFDELLVYLASLDLKINVEIKPTPGKDIETARVVVDVLNQYWKDRKQYLIVSSFSLKSLEEVYRLDPDLSLGLLAKKWFNGWHDKLLSLKCVSLHAKAKILKPHIVKQLRSEGFFVLAYTVDNPRYAQLLFDWGVNSVFSNVPDVIEQLCVTS